MAVQPYAKLTPTQLEAFKNLYDRLPTLPQPFHAASNFAMEVAANPMINEQFCKLVGKVVIVVTSVPHRTNTPLTLRIHGGQGRDRDIPASNLYPVDDPDGRSFTFHMPSELMHAPLTFKLCSITPKATHSSKVWTIDLKEYGLFAVVKLGQATDAFQAGCFKELATDEEETYTVAQEPFSQLTQHQRGAFENLEDVMLSLPQPIKGAANYAIAVAMEPMVHQQFCGLVGKIVHVVASVAPGTTNRITLREERGLNKDIPSNEALDPNARRFTLHIPKDRMNEQIQFKLRMIAPNATLLSSHKVWTIDPKDYGFITFINIGHVAFV